MTRQFHNIQLEEIKPYIDDTFYEWISLEIQEGKYDGKDFWECVEETLESLCEFEEWRALYKGVL